MSGEHHKQVRIEWRGKSAEVDEAMAGIILALWQAGIETRSSCQDIDHVAYVGFDSLNDAKRVQQMIGSQTMTHVEEPNAQDRANASKASWDAGYTTAEGGCLIMFGTEAISIVRRAIQRARYS